MDMTKMDRLIAECVYISEIREFKHKDIMEEFGISRSTSYNDLRFLKEYMHVPIDVKDDGSGLYIYGTWTFFSVHLKSEYQNTIIELIHILEKKYKIVLINILNDYGDKNEAEKLRRMYLG